jgi:hypothetical protein
VAEASPLGGVRRRRRLVVGVGAGAGVAGFAADVPDGLADPVRGRLVVVLVDVGLVDAEARRVERLGAGDLAAAGLAVDPLPAAALVAVGVGAGFPTVRFVPVVGSGAAAAVPPGAVAAVVGTVRFAPAGLPAAGFAAPDRRLTLALAPADTEPADPAADRGPGLRPRRGLVATDGFTGGVTDDFTGDTAVAASTAADPTAVAAPVAASPASPIAARAQSPIRPTIVATSAAASSSWRRRFAICFRPCFASARASCSIRRVSVARAASSFLPSLARSRAVRFVRGAAAARADATRSPAAASTSVGTLDIVCFADRFDAFAITRLRSGRTDIWVPERHGTVPPRGQRRTECRSAGRPGVSDGSDDQVDMTTSARRAR